MLELLRAPLTVSHSLGAAAAALTAVTLYCLGYTALAGQAESPAEAASWAIVNVLPWLAAFEVGKRTRRLRVKVLVLGCALGMSLALGAILGDGNGIGMELVRRTPGLLVVACLLAVTSLPAKKPPARGITDRAELPLPPEAIEWVAAAGNYVELHGLGRVVMHRVPLSVVEAQLAPRGFVRVHRSKLVRRDCIARVRPLDLILKDGTTLTTGKRYRALLGSGSFVPSSHAAGGVRADAP